MTSVKDFVRQVFSKAKNEATVLKGEKSKDKIFYSRKEFSERQTAVMAYQEAVKRLFDINGWNNIPAIANSKFTLYNSEGERSNDTKPKEGYFIKIELPGPTPENWVMITDVKEEENGYIAEFITSPSPAPANSAKSDLVTEHFFRSESTSTFRVSLRDTILTAYEIGRNEAINNKAPEAGNRATMNVVLAEGGWLGFQNYQWKHLTDYIIEGK